jgi:hypothetical protein
MKKMLPAVLLLLPVAVSAQVGGDTLLWEDFNTDPSTRVIIGTPSGTFNDTAWYTLDNDLLPDGSASGRPDEWFWSAAYSDNDTINNPGVMGSNSWTNDAVTPVSNWLITPALVIADTAADLHWKSAPRQTPRYLDGYMVLVSTGTNDITQFTDTLFVASEYTSLDVPANQNSFAAYTFTPSNGFVHGMDGTFTEFDPAADSSRLIGRLRPFEVDLSMYAGQTIYIAFLHNSIDDNLISVDDIRVEGTDVTGIEELATTIPMHVFPNPANEMVRVNYTLPAESDVLVNIYSMDGKVVRSEDQGTRQAGSNSATLDVRDLAPGVYLVSIQTEEGISSRRIVVE